MEIFPTLKSLICIRIIFVAWLVFFGIARAQPPSFVDNGQVLMFPSAVGDNESIPFNLYREYPATINWYMPSDSRQMILRRGENTQVAINLHQHILNGFRAWSEASGVTFNEVENYGSANIRIYVLADDPLSSYSRSLARTTRPANQLSTITFFHSGWSAIYPDGDAILELEERMPAGSMAADAINFMAARTSMHEIGHALGFLHPGQFIARGTPTAVEMLPNYPNPTPAIMDPSEAGFDELYLANNERPISIANLGISVQERAVLNTLRSNHQARGRERLALPALLFRGGGARGSANPAHSEL
ncbi:matrixin family metalloprotease [Burkholderia cenocepacia]|uniref:matrixin family metalloprotease n=1 Tax=Burkholderia cenocepacia TaxID=95486 RepID=UPI002B23FB6F|nr:matrixin family metalloprotease [Burkholderia cenocepacia]MEB2558820.1 matrixin family metalloprotease [Burkholderia cenocepacia]